MNLSKIIVQAKKRLKADAKATFLQYIEKILGKYDIKKKSTIYPKEYVAQTGPEIVKTLTKDFGQLGFKFEPFAAHSPNAIALESSGIYRSLEYIIDIVFHGGDLKVDVYF